MRWAVDCRWARMMRRSTLGSEAHGRAWLLECLEGTAHEDALAQLLPTLGGSGPDERNELGGGGGPDALSLIVTDVHRSVHHVEYLCRTVSVHNPVLLMPNWHREHSQIPDWRLRVEVLEDPELKHTIGETGYAGSS
ncbi:hypothetical protein NDU88_003282 [Pleurodeles waltl]|uniref:Uncharacterized protein n=1 Tax=Pleurodeles waltl TaxID=8319 RepID=A0AAV7Q980_PLEWA|nr:hypothetical protein NDU88_003282 [Pleurodeles waltl]